MSFWVVGYRTSMVWSLAFWLGGFTFYSAVVIPILHEQLGGSMEAGLVTQRVTDFLNYLGLLTIALGWIGILTERFRSLPRKVSSTWGFLLLTLTSTCLFLLLGLHEVLDHKLESESFSGFYRLHRVYLWVSVIQWLANLGLMACWVEVREPADPGSPQQESSSSGAPNAA